MQNQAEKWINFVYSWIENPNFFCEEDWKNWRPLLETSCAQVMDETPRRKGVKALRFLNLYFPEKN
jgi:hypothetical protein